MREGQRFSHWKCHRPRRVSASWASVPSSEHCTLVFRGIHVGHLVLLQANEYHPSRESLLTYVSVIDDLVQSEVENELVAVPTKSRLRSNSACCQCFGPQERYSDTALCLSGRFSSMSGRTTSWTHTALDRSEAVKLHKSLVRVQIY